MTQQSKAAAARSEKSKQPKPKSFTWKGIKFDLPDKLPGDLAFEMADAEVNQAQISPAFQFVRSVVGEERYARIRAKVTEEGLDLAEAALEMEQILSSIVKKYGLGPGESEASQLS